jgi:hypothetical protein
MVFSVLLIIMNHDYFISGRSAMIYEPSAMNSPLLLRFRHYSLPFSPVFNDIAHVAGWDIVAQ